MVHPVIELLSIPRVLFVCVHNGGRSQMCEAFLRKRCNDFFDAHSAGLKPGELNPLVVKAMAEIGIDISGNKTKSVFSVWRSGQMFRYVIAVCEKEAAERCPIFPGIAQRFSWPFEDPAKVTGTDEKKMEKVRQIRDKIRTQIDQFCDQYCTEAFS
jgi:arsenate reductase